jgi:diguanylate cyclase (GGDEF)-like protein
MLSHHILIIEGVADRYRQQAAVLREAGYTVRSFQPETLVQLEEHLATTTTDIVLYGKGDRVPDLESVIALLIQDSADIPLVVIVDKLTKRSATAAENCGAAAVVQNGQSKELLRAVNKALRTVMLHRRVSRLENDFELVRLQYRINDLENRLREQEVRRIDLTEDCRSAIAYIHEGVHIYANHSYCNLLGLDNDDEIIGAPLSNWIDAGPGPVHELPHNRLSRQGITKLKVRLVQDEADPIEADAEFSVVEFDNRLCTQITVRDSSERANDERLPDTLKHHDVTTGLYIRQYFMDVLEKNITSSVKSGLFQAVTFILLDNFKTIREKIGVAASDDLIREIAGLIRETYGHENMIARFGDYTFTILNNYGYKEGAHQLAETLRARIEKHTMAAGEHIVSTTCSIGICVINEHVKDAQNAHSRADLACELARTSGGNQIHVHSTTIDAQIDRDIDKRMDDMVRRTIDEDRFYLAYQPVISLNGRSDGHYEVLLRILDEDGHGILPGQFLAMAEKSPLIMEIDRRVIQMAFRTLAGMQEKKGNISFFIKLSGESLLDPQLPGWISQQLGETGLQGDYIIFEIPESVAARRTQETQAFVKGVQALDCKVAIEHFGYANKPEIIKYLSVDFLKIDGSLINNLASNKDNQNKVRSIVDLARSTRTLSIAEHVDDAHCLVKLWQYNIDFIQGNLVQEPSTEFTHDFEDEAVLAGIME